MNTGNGSLDNNNWLNIGFDKLVESNYKQRLQIYLIKCSDAFKDLIAIIITAKTPSKTTITAIVFSQGKKPYLTARSNLPKNVLDSYNKNNLCKKITAQIKLRIYQQNNEFACSP